MQPNPLTALLWRLLAASLFVLFASTSFAAAPAGSWWNTTFPYRYKLTIPAGSSDLDAGYAVSITFNHAAAVTAGTSLASGDDVRIVRWNGTAWVELDRVSSAPETWNTASTRVWFKTAATINSGVNNDDYYLYYGKTISPGAPPANGENVFTLHDEFTDATLSTTRWTVSGTGTVTTGTGSLTLFPGRILQSDATFGLDTIWEARALTSDTLPGGGSKFFYLWTASNTSSYNSNHLGFYADVADYHTTARNSGATVNDYTSSTPTAFHIYSFTREFVVFIFVFPYSNFSIDGTLIDTISTGLFSYTVPTIALPVMVKNDANGSRTQVYDWMRVRPYRNPEPVPTRGTLEQVSSGLHHFVVAHDGYGINCLAETITVSPKDSTNAAVTTYNQQITLTTNTGKGTWTKVTGTGTFTDATANDGLATYQWVSGETSASFSLFYPEGQQSFDVDAYQTSNTALRDDDTEGNLSFSPAGFTVASSATGIAGTEYNTTITAYGQTSSNPLCSVITGYTGAKSLKFWTSYTNPTSGTVRFTVNGTASAGTEGAAVAQSVTFTNGVSTTLTTKYKDVGSVTLNVKDDTTGNPSLPTGIRGSVAMILKPARFGLVATGPSSAANPAAVDANGGIFIAAGRPFSVTATAYDADGTATPNYGKETSPESVALTQALVAPSPGVNGTFTNATFGAFTGGSATATSLSWAEVGIISLTPRVADSDYLGIGNVTATATNVGRFVPADFSVSVATTPVMQNACTTGGFSYVGQTLTYTTAPILTVTARNTSGGTTQNYTGAFYKLTAPTGQTTYTSSTGTPTLTGTAIDPTAASLGAGVGRLTYPSGSLGMAFTRTATAPIAPFTPTITLSLALRDTDNVAVAASPYLLNMTAGPQRYGRLAFRNAVGSELIPLSVPLRAEFYMSDALGFVANTSDKCSTGIGVSLTTFAGNLSSGETCVLDSGTSCATAPSISSRVLDNGDFKLRLAAPGAGNQGTVTLTAPTMPTWLQYDWDPATLGIQNPTGIANFGIYQGNSTRLYTRERY